MRRTECRKKLPRHVRPVLHPVFGIEKRRQTLHASGIPRDVPDCPGSSQRQSRPPHPRMQPFSITQPCDKEREHGHEAYRHVDSKRAEEEPFVYAANGMGKLRGGNRDYPCGHQPGRGRQKPPPACEPRPGEHGQPHSVPRQLPPEKAVRLRRIYPRRAMPAEPAPHRRQKHSGG